VTSTASEWDCTINNVPSSAIDSFVAVAQWYLTVRRIDPTCARLIAFQKTPFHGDNPDLRLRAIGSLSAPALKRRFAMWAVYVLAHYAGVTT
jgi:hypothetical protein